EHHERVWASKRAALVASFPADVLAALQKMGIVEIPSSAAPAEPAPEPPPAATEPAVEQPITEQPESVAPVALTALYDALVVVDPVFAQEGRATIETWTEEQRLSALTWARAVIDDGPMILQSRRPAHTMMIVAPEIQSVIAVPAQRGKRKAS